jgi:hypothetical protein
LPHPIGKANRRDCKVRILRLGCRILALFARVRV